MVLIVLCGASIMKPMRFNKEKRLREAAVKERLISIRQAEEKYKAQTGAYTGDFATLVDAGLLADSMRYVPFSGGKEFTLGATAACTVALAACTNAATTVSEQNSPSEY